MSQFARPQDILTRTNGMIGTPFVEWAFALENGGFGPFRDVGITTDGVEIQNNINNADMRDSRSGSSVLVRRHTNEFDFDLAVQTKLFNAKNTQLMLLAAGITEVSAGTATVTNEIVTLTDDAGDFIDLANALVDESTMVVTAAPIVDEFVGTGQGTGFGPTTGDFALDFGPFVVADITSYLETTSAGVVNERVGDIVAGTSPTSGQIGIEEGAIATSGRITYFTAEGPASGTLIEVTYEPTHTITQDVDFFSDPKEGRVRAIFSTNKLRGGQSIEVSYEYNQLDHSAIDPGTQLTLPGRVRIRHLVDAGVNWVWLIPKASVQASGEAFSFTADQWNTHTIMITMENDGSSVPYGTLQIYNETLVAA